MVCCAAGRLLATGRERAPQPLLAQPVTPPETVTCIRGATLRPDHHPSSSRTRRYLTAIQLTSQHLLRYLAVAVVVNKRESGWCVCCGIVCTVHREHSAAWTFACSFAGVRLQPGLPPALQKTRLRAECHTSKPARPPDQSPTIHVVGCRAAQRAQRPEARGGPGGVRVQVGGGLKL